MRHIFWSNTATTIEADVKHVEQRLSMLNTPVGANPKDIQGAEYLYVDQAQVYRTRAARDAFFSFHQICPPHHSWPRSECHF